jgi:hypothetical protein
VKKPWQYEQWPTYRIDLPVQLWEWVQEQARLCCLSEQAFIARCLYIFAAGPYEALECPRCDRGDPGGSSDS